MAVPCKTKQAPLHRRNRGRIKITCTEESVGGMSHSSYDSMLTPMVDKVQEALKSSSLELQAAVQDPLPESVKVAASLVPDGAETAPNPLQQDQAGKDVRAHDPSLDGSATDAAPAMQGDCQAQPCGHQDVLPRRSLMERNSSAQTHQWDDSPEGTSDQKDRPRLHSPKRLAVSPLRTAEPPKASKRRRRKGWSLQEEETLRNGVARFGQGNWKLIRDCYSDIFEDRTEVDLKDKWRNMMR